MARDLNTLVCAMLPDSFMTASGIKRKCRKVSPVVQRCAANRRERCRMRSINEAFDGLRTHVPTLPYEKKLSKVDTLRLAIDYIQFLKDLVERTQLEDELTGEHKVIICCSQQVYGQQIITGHSLSWRRRDSQTDKKVVTRSIWTPETSSKCSDG